MVMRPQPWIKNYRPLGNAESRRNICQGRVSPTGYSVLKGQNWNYIHTSNIIRTEQVVTYVFINIYKNSKKQTPWLLETARWGAWVGLEGVLKVKRESAVTIIYFQKFLKNDVYTQKMYTA